MEIIMANERVYLFELDSVRVSEEECKVGKEKLYLELMRGNIVVLSYNQIASIIMYDLLDIAQAKHTREPILELMNKKRICVSQFGNGTIIGYLTKNMLQTDHSFIFSGLKFLNGIDREGNSFAEIAELLRGEKQMRGWRDISSQEFTEEQKKILFDYISVMRELPNKIEHIKAHSAADGHDLKYYIARVCDAMLKGNVTLHADEVRAAVTSLEAACDSFSGGMNRSDCIKKLTELHASNESSELTDSERIARSILDISYNYQVERSIKGVTVTHDIDDEGDVVAIVTDYYRLHSFNDGSEYAPPSKPAKILNWEAVAELCPRAKKSTEEGEVSFEAWKKVLKRSLGKRLLKTAGIILILISLISLSNFFDWVTTLRALLYYAAVPLYVLYETITWLIPTSNLLDGAVSIVEYLRLRRTLKVFLKREEPYYITLSIKERIKERTVGRGNDTDD